MSHDPLLFDERAAASTVEQERDKALSALNAALEQKVTPARIRHTGPASAVACTSSQPRSGRVAMNSEKNGTVC